MTTPMKIGASAVMHFVRISTFEECQRVLPELTRAQYDGLRAGTLRLTGDSDALELEEVKA